MGESRRGGKSQNFFLRSNKGEEKSLGKIRGDRNLSQQLVGGGEEKLYNVSLGRLKSAMG